jgi:hypothetical protein
VSQDEIMRVVQGIKDVYGENLAETFEPCMITWG